ncbi:hypothetical protein GU926_14930 [Nibribacter ruber]|uniref:DUF1735 domain-containing protein n=1 Tax=Nibribacter ruber TaxID=2698458 RepID=A0A6P1P2N6_9BACT|nr:hypothetical protein [Nibribacter ruber]QHL88651.1 hypothetical protein GU926_14930 [Nibribacter ruber]
MKNKFILGSLLALAIGFTSCDFEEEDESYDGPLQVEFDSTPASAYRKSFTLAGATRIDSFKVQLIGPHQSEAINGTIKVDPNAKKITDPNGTNLLLDNAVEGTDFTLTNGGKYIIPANSSFGYVKYTMIKPADGRTKVLGLELQENEKVKVAFNYKTATATFK